MKIREIFFKLKDQIKSNYQAWYILSGVLKKDKLQIILDFEKEIDLQKQIVIEKILKKCKENYPLPYIFKKVEFFGIEFEIEEGVFIPRPETEVLVGEVINIYNAFFKPKRVYIVDVGCGCGNIGIAIAMNIPSKVIFLDISKKAIYLAKKNAKAYNIKGNFVICDLLSCFKGNFDFIVANLPYISPSEYKSLPILVRREPKSALIAQENGIFLNKKLIQEAKRLTKFLLFEIGYNQEKRIEELLKGNDFYFKEDLNKIKRVCVVKFKGV